MLAASRAACGMSMEPRAPAETRAQPPNSAAHVVNLPSYAISALHVGKSALQVPARPRLLLQLAQPAASC